MGLTVGNTGTWEARSQGKQVTLLKFGHKEP